MRQVNASQNRRAASRRKVVVEASTGSRIIEQSRVRLMFVGVFFMLCYVSIAVRLVEMMISAPHPLPAMFSQGDFGISKEPEDFEVKGGEARIQRGDIVDRNGVLVATSVMVASAFANPREISNPEVAAQKLEKALGISGDNLLKRFKSNKTFVWIKRHLTPAEQQAVNTLGIPGIYFQPEEKRLYPYGSLLSHAVGYVGVDNKGLAGVEKQFDQQLGDEVLSHTPLMLSIDVRLQHMLKDEISAAVDEFRAIGGAGVIADVNTGEVLAMVSMPDFDPNRPARARDEQRFNRVALGTYEMGSTFKTFTMAMGLDYGVTRLNGGYDATNPLKYASFTISDTHPKKRWLSVPEIYAYSSNIGTARMALDVGLKRQKAFLDKIGMLKPVEIELPEKAQPLYPKDWKEINGITISYGHGISVTPLHLVRGIAALVNGGLLTPLTVLKNGNVGKAEPDRVIKEKTSEAIARLMRLVVKHGTGSKADVAGYRVGGKTGTAEKVSAGGGYNRDNKMASFVGVFPVDAPKYVVLVMIDEPKGNKATFGYATGGWVAAPAVGRVIARMGTLTALQPVYDTPTDDAEKYWVDTDKKQPTLAAAPRTAPPAAADPRYVHSASY